MSKKESVRFLIPVHSDNFKEGIKKIGELFKVETFSGLHPSKDQGSGFIYVWVSDNSIECCFSTNLHDWFEYDALISGVDDIESLPLLYKILR